MVDPKDNGIPISAYFPYVIPFLTYAGFTYLALLLGIPKELAYPGQILTVLVLLICFWPRVRQEIRPFWDMNAIMAGIFAFILWIGLEGHYQPIGTPEGFNPHELAAGRWVWGIAGIRLAGAALVVPLMEELFWRSFALRFLINSAFTRIPLGAFSWFSFIFVSLAFGLEHHRWIPGILTGMLYAMVLYQRKNLFSPILAHGVTNLLLGIHVLVNEAWEFW